MKIFIGAGEASGDRMLAPVLKGLRARLHGLELRGFGGPHCESEGLESLLPMERLAVNGIGDVLRRAPSLLAARARLRRELRSFRPDLVLLADYPGMNVGLAGLALSLGFPVHYVAPPQLWAYRNPARRLARLKAALGGASLQVLFPFEAPPYAPWARRIRQGHFFPAPAAEAPRGDRLLLCPGSRRGVLRRNLPRWLDHLAIAGIDMDTVDILVPEFLAGEARAIAAGAPICNGDPDGRGMPRPYGPTIATNPPAAFARAGAAIAFPGTITLELLLHGIPAQVWGILDPLTLRMGRRVLRGPQVALANLIAGRLVFPEWIGTAGDFRRAPPVFPPLDEWSSVEAECVCGVWQMMGSERGTDTAVDACLEISRSRE